MSWLRLFRVVNLPTVPGDVLVGAAVAFAAGGRTGAAPNLLPAWWAAGAGLFMYMFGLADNDIAGASYDTDRPIPNGELSLASARVARGLCLFAVLVAGSIANLPPAWWICAFALALACVVYNRTKLPLLMGLCRALNLVCGIAAAHRAANFRLADFLPFGAAFAALWLLYVAAVTKYSEGEEKDAAKKHCVGFLVGAVVYMQLAALVVLAVLHPNVAELRPLLVVGAVMLVALRVFKTVFRTVSAS